MKCDLVLTRTLPWALGVAGALIFSAQCGARTGLLVPFEAQAEDVRTEDVRAEDAREEEVVVIDATGNCPTEATLIYVTGTGGALYSFWPPSFTFTLVGNLTCTSSPTHMTVDRHGVAWVVANSKLYRASTTDASCIEVDNWTANPAPGFNDFALSFVGTTLDDTSLYILGSPDLGLFDTKAGTFTVIGAPGVSTFGDMTSNGDGTLYYLQDVATPTLYELDPKTASIMQTYSVNAQGGGAQALAFFGGLFYAFESNVVSSFDTVTKTTTELGTAPLDVTGAGQSTCVPDTPTDASLPDSVAPDD